MAFFLYSLPAWHCATLIKTVLPKKEIIFFCAERVPLCLSVCKFVGKVCLLATSGYSVRMKVIVSARV